MSEELAAYIAEYVNQEYQKRYHNHRTGPFPQVTRSMILEAIESYVAERVIKEGQDG